MNETDPDREFVDCLICQKDETMKMLMKNSFSIVRCQNCGLVYVNPRPAEKQIEEIYSSQTNPRPLEHIKEEQIKLKWKFREGISLLSAAKEKERLLDIGCSTGVFLNMAKAAGWKVLGLDLNEDVVESAKREYGIDAKVGTLDSMKFPSGHFSAVTLFDSIEHMGNPGNVLTEIYRILRPGGLLLLTTPNISGLLPTVTYQIFGKLLNAWEHPEPPGHLYQFSWDTLKRIFEQKSFRLYKTRSHMIPLTYTVGELENSIIEGIRQKSHVPPSQSNVKSSIEVDSKRASHEENVAEDEVITLRGLIKKIPRLLVRVLSWGVVLVLWPLSQVFGAGDAMMVLAIKE